jgi:flavin reductase (DIM6/NTAB) family NADH-FMN oxidoreductase RutF
MSARTEPREQDVRAFHRAFPTGVTVVSVMTEDGPAGITVNAFASVSLDPATIVVCINQTSSLVRALTIGRPFAVNVLSEDQRVIAHRFATHGVDRFASVPFGAAPEGSPWLRDAVAVLEATLTSCTPVGTHYMCLGQVTSLEARKGRPLLYLDGELLQPPQPLSPDQPRTQEAA